jgi:hypothetical protein
MITRDTLNRRICDVEKEATNTQTYKEFIKEFGLQHESIELYTSVELQGYLRFLNELWDK